MAPREGAKVDDAVDVVVTAEPGQTESAEFTLLLDGELVGRDGSVGAAAAFPNFSLKAGDTMTVPLRGLAGGKHTLVVRYASDADNAKQDFVRNFRVEEGGNDLTTVAVGFVVALVLAAAFVARRNALRPLRQ